jgi:hypothetical protein
VKSKLTNPKGEESDIYWNGQRNIYLDGIEVFCNPIQRLGDEPRHLSILIKASQLPNIIQFYGLLNDYGGTFMILECAQFGDLQSLYESTKITLDLKVSFDIFFLIEIFLKQL